MRPRGTVDANGHLQRAGPFDGVVEGHTLRENVTQGKEEKRLLGRRRRLKKTCLFCVKSQSFEEVSSILARLEQWGSLL